MELADEPIIDLLLDAGVDVPSEVARREDSALTLLMAAAARRPTLNGTAELIDLLLEAGADPCLKSDYYRADWNGKTALGIALSTGNSDAIGALDDVLC